MPSRAVTPIPLAERPGGTGVKTSTSAAEIRRVSLRFRDRQLEDEFAEMRYARSVNMIRGARALGAVVLLLLVPLDAVLVPVDKVDMVRLLRLLLIVPILLIALIVTFIVSSHRIALPILAASIAVVGLTWSLMLILAGPETTSYIYPNVIVTVLFIYFMLGLPFRFAMPIAWGISIMHILTAYFAFPELPAEQFLAVLAPVLTICAIATYADYQIQLTARELYLQSVKLRAEQIAREESDNARLDWLENMARFLRHELRNTMIGISSSLELMSRRGVSPEADVYLGRAQRSVTHMRKLVSDSAEATTLELSLKHDQPGPLELSEWLTDQVEIYRQAHPDREFLLDVRTRATVATIEERITQLLDKLVSNAIEHAAENTAIHIGLTSDATDAVLSVSDHGDTLPEDKASIFGLYSSTKAGSATENIGLGLHIARLIAEAHGGSIHAIDLRDPPGARFEVRLPMGYFNFRNRAGRDHR
jgi:signal transduction histidine kinase